MSLMNTIQTSNSLEVIEYFKSKNLIYSQPPKCTKCDILMCWRQRNEVSDGK